MASNPITLWQIDGEKVETVIDCIFLGSKIYADCDCSHKIKRCLLLGRKDVTCRQLHKKQRHHSADKGPYNQSYDFSSSHVRMWQLNHKEGWALKNWCLQVVVLQKTLEGPLDCKSIKPVSPKRNKHWVFIGKTDLEAPIIWPPDMKNWLIEKDPDAGKDWGQEEKGVTENEMVGWHYWLNGHEFEQIPRDGEIQGSLACCSPWVRKEPDVLRGWSTTLSPPVSTSPSVSLFLPCRWVHQHHFYRFHICALIYDIYFSFSDLTGSRFIHITSKFLQGFTELGIISLFMAFWLHLS